MFKVDLPLEPKEQARIDARRNREEQRKSRIFDAKTVHTRALLGALTQQRTTGMDYDALTMQIEERKQREAEEKEFNAAAGLCV